MIVGLAVAPDGRLFVIEKRGRVYIIQDDWRLASPFIDLGLEVLDNGDRGLLGIALDPNFATTPWVYLLYSVDPDGDGVDTDVPTFGRLTRYRASAGDPNVADLGSRQVLIGATWPAGIPCLHNTHGTGSLRFGEDGTLLVSTGDGAFVSPPDAGGRHPTAFGPGKFPTSENIGAFRSQWLGSLAGKILRIDPQTGGGLPSNPYYTGNAFDNASRVWAYGLRNPYRFQVRPGTGSLDPAAGRPGVLCIAEVGWVTWEEVNFALPEGGENFGWPCREGRAAAADYPSLTPAHHGCGTLGTPDNPRLPKDPPITWHHSSASLSTPTGLLGKCSSAIAFYTGTNYPAPYRGACFFADYDAGWIRAARVDQNYNLIEVLDFATETQGPVDLVADPDTQDLYYVSILRNQIRRIRYDPTNNMPAAQAAGTPTSGTPPLTVQFSSADSTDPDGDPLTFRWLFGDGEISTAANPSHTYLVAGSHTATLTVDDGRGGQSSAVVVIDAQGGTANTPPIADILAPENTSLFLARAELFLSGTASDAEDPTSALQFSWEVILHHNTHIHPGWLQLQGQTASFIPYDHDDGTGTWLEIVLRATDTGGLTGMQKVFVYPNSQPLLLDNGDPGTVSSGRWLVSGASHPYGSDSVYSKTAGHTYGYNFDLPAPGSYRVFAWWTVLSSRPTAVPYTILHALGTETVRVNQRDPAGDDLWHYLGTFSFGDTARVTITAEGGNLSTGADAVCLLPAGATDPTPVATIDSVLPSPGAVGQPVSFAGHGEDNGSITSYLWRSSIDGALSTQPSFVTSSLSAGTHTIFFRVTDDRGSPSEDAERVLQVGVAAPPGEVILDNGQPGTSSNGPWTLSGSPDPYGGSSLYTKTAGRTYTYSLGVPAAGIYDVYAWWTQASGRTNAALYASTYATGAHTVKVDQRTNGGRWNYLGTFRFGAAPTVTITAPSGGVSTCADAVRLVYRGNTDAILDSGDPGTSSTGVWTASTGPNPYGPGSLFAKGPAGTYTWVLGTQAPGTHEVFAWWTTASSRSTQARYTMTHAGGATTVLVNQTANGGRWNSLGTFTFGASATVRLDALADGKSYAADAIRVRRVGP